MISRSDKWGLVLSILVFVLVAGFSLPAAAKILVVGKSEAEFSSIQLGIDAADPGDTVHIRALFSCLDPAGDGTLRGIG